MVVVSKITSGVQDGIIFSDDRRSCLAKVAYSLELRRRVKGDSPLRGFFVAQEHDHRLEMGRYRLRLADGSEEAICIDHLLPVKLGSRQIGSFEFVED